MNGWCVVGSPAPSQEEDEEALCLESVGQTLTTTLVPSKAYIPPLNKEMCFIDVDKAGCTTLSDEGAKWYTGFVDLGDDIEVRGINAKEKLDRQKRREQYYSNLETIKQDFEPELYEKTCPECFEKIKLPAKICRFCRRQFTSEKIKSDIEEKFHEIYPKPE